ncbi:MAG: RSP_2647 family RNA methyltransferase [Planktomarina sp.]
MIDTLPRLRLKPKTDARRVRHGFPWIYANELVMDRRSKAIAPGALAVLEDADRNAIAQVTVNTGSKIAARVLDLNLDATIDAAWIAAKIQTALSLREALFDAPYYRLIHAEADGLPGVIVDRFGDTCVIQPNTAWADANLEAFKDGLANVVQAKTILMNGTGRARGLEGLEETRTVLQGHMPDAPLQVPMNGATYMADLAEGQKTGLFYDQRPNHQFAKTLAKGADVLDVFSHVGGFGLAAKAGGAASVTCVDGSAAALDLAAQGGALTPGDGTVNFVKSEAFAALERFASEGRQFDVVICDPPAFAPSKPALEAGLRAYEKVARMAAPLVKSGGFLGLCSCSHAATVDKFRASNARGIGRAGRTASLIYTGGAGPDHPQHLALGESSYLKALFYRVL